VTGEVPDAAPVQTYRGPVPAADLGWTLTHEHLFVLSPELDRDHPHPEWDPDAAVDRAVAGLEELYDLGVRTVVDLTVPGLGRDVALVGRVAARVRVNLLAATGWYTDAVLPPYFRTHGPGRLVGGPDPLVEMFLRDLEEGVAGTGVRAAVIKVVTDEPGLTPDVSRVLAAAAVAQQRTGVPVVTHSNPHLRTGLDQLRVLGDAGVDLRRVVVGHSGDTPDRGYLRALLDHGATIGVDRLGMAHVADDDVMVDSVVTLAAEGYADRIVLSHDAAYFSRVTPPSWRREHAPHWRHDHLARCVLPRLRAAGVSADDLDRMTTHNARRLLTPSVEAAA
jgi:phosphotriesterase-related protein